MQARQEVIDRMNEIRQVIMKQYDELANKIKGIVVESEAK